MLATMFASLIGRLGSSAFQTVHHSSIDVAHGPALPFGIGTQALPAWDSRTRWTNLLGGLDGKPTAGPSTYDVASSIVP